MSKSATESRSIIDLNDPALSRESQATVRVRLPPPEPSPSDAPPAIGVRGRHDTPPTSFAPRPSLRDRPILTVLAGTHAGAVHHLDRTRPTLIGRGEECDIQLEDPAVSRHHARVVRESTGGYAIVDLGSTNGTYVNAQRVTRVSLSTGFRIQLGPETVLRFALVDETEDALNERLYELSTRDPLTGLFNRKYFFERLGAELLRAKRTGDKLGVVMLDLDHFKRVNDTLGHAAGDRVLRAVARRASDVLRAADVLARYGGEELVAIVRAGDSREVAAAAERMRAAVEQLDVALDGGPMRVTVSAGVATAQEDPEASAAELVARADVRLYRAKLAGRNRVVARD